MLDDEMLALDAAALARVAQELVRQLLHETRARQTQTLELLRIDQASGAVVTEHELITLDDIGPAVGLRRAETVADDLEHEIVGGQRENDHYQAAIARRVHEAVDRGVEMALQREVALALALLGAAEHGVELVDRLARHERAQQRDGRADDRQVDMEIRAGVAEQRADVSHRHHYRIDLAPRPGSC